MKGFVKWWADLKGFGFITGDDKKDYFFHFSEVAGPGRKTFTPYQEVEFMPDTNAKGLRAREVKLV